MASTTIEASFDSSAIAQKVLQQWFSDKSHWVTLLLNSGCFERGERASQLERHVRMEAFFCSSQVIIHPIWVF